MRVRDDDAGVGQVAAREHLLREEGREHERALARVADVAERRPALEAAHLDGQRGGGGGGLPALHDPHAALAADALHFAPLELPDRRERRRRAEPLGVALSGRGEAPLDFNPLAMEWFYNKGISLIAVSGNAGTQYPSARRERDMHGPAAVKYVLDLMADGALEPKRLVTHRMHYSRMAEAYDMIDRREKSMLGVIFQWKEP